MGRKVGGGRSPPPSGRGLSIHRAGDATLARIHITGRSNPDLSRYRRFGRGPGPISGRLGALSGGNSVPRLYESWTDISPIKTSSSLYLSSSANRKNPCLRLRLTNRGDIGFAMVWWVVALLWARRWFSSYVCHRKRFWVAVGIAAL